MPTIETTITAVFSGIFAALGLAAVDAPSRHGSPGMGPLEVELRPGWVLVAGRAREKSSAPKDRRSEVRRLMGLGKTVEALAEYERLASEAGREDDELLQELALGFILPLRHDMREQMRGAAYTALKEANSEEVVPYFEEGLSDGSGLVRALVAEGLGKLHHGRKSPGFRRALNDQAALVRVAVLKGLRRSADPAVIPLIESALDDEEPTVRVAAAAALFAKGQKQRWTMLEKAAAAENRFERRAALRALGEVGDARALPILTNAARDPQPSLRASAAAALGDLARPEAAPVLIEVIADQIPAVRSVAVTSLGKLGTSEVRPLLAAKLSDPNPGVRAAAVAALLRLGTPFDEVAKTVRQLAQDRNPGIRSSVARALAHGHGQEVVGILSALLDDPVPRPRIGATRALGRIGNRHVLPLLKEALHDADQAVQATAGGAILRILRGSSQPVARSGEQRTSGFARSRTSLQVVLS